MYPLSFSLSSSHQIDEIKSWTDGAGAYDHAAFVSFLACDQRLKDLREATLDGMVFQQIDFSGADLRGANLSDVRAHACRFYEADLVDVCLADSVFEVCDFRYARLSAVMMAGARVRNCRFAGWGALMLPWAVLDQNTGNTYETRDGDILSLDTPPLVMIGAAQEMALVDGKILIDNSIIS